MKKKFSVLLMVILLFILGGCKMSKEKTVTKEEQIAFLKEHEKEMTDYIKSQNKKVTSVQWDWDSVVVGNIGNGTPQGGGTMWTIRGGFNEIKDSDFILSTSSCDGENFSVGLLSSLSILKNGGWYIYE